MKKILLMLMTAAFIISGMSSCAAQAFGRKDVTLPLNLIHTDAAFKQFKKASKMNQLEIISEFIRQANEQYKECETIEEIRDLRENVALINRYLVSGKQSFMSAQKDYNILYNKINKTIREYEGAQYVVPDTGGFYDFGQELD
jgi:hypothetical protein